MFATIFVSSQIFQHESEAQLEPLCNAGSLFNLWQNCPEEPLRGRGCFALFTFLESVWSGCQTRVSNWRLLFLRDINLRIWKESLCWSLCCFYVHPGCSLCSTWFWTLLFLDWVPDLGLDGSLSQIYPEVVGSFSDLGASWDNLILHPVCI